MQKIAIAIDDWKEKVFRATLEEDGWEYEIGPGLTDDTRTITVETSSVQRLVDTIRSCQRRAAALKN